jgi:hypothetical protein
MQSLLASCVLMKMCTSDIHVQCVYFGLLHVDNEIKCASLSQNLVKRRAAENMLWLCNV